MLIYLVAGEASGDLLGGRLMLALRAARPGVTFAGVGGEGMQAAGLRSLFPMRELSLMGAFEIAPRMRQIFRRLDQTEADALARRPAVVVTIDAPAFNLRLAARLRVRGLRVVHYVAPQVWAWRRGRVRKTARQVDRLLALLPFEPPFFEAAGLPTRFVGHPILETGVERGDAARFRAAHAIGADTPLLAVMPGSRRGEVARLLPRLGDAVARLAREVPGLRPIVPTLPAVAAQVRTGIADWPGAPILVTEGKPDALAAVVEAGGAGLIKSGTSSLEMAVAGLPHVVAYRLNPLTAAIARRLIRIPYASLVNLLAAREVVPERHQERCTGAELAAAMLPLLRDPEARAAQRGAFRDAVAQLRPPAGLPSEAAAAAVLELADAAPAQIAV